MTSSPRADAASAAARLVRKNGSPAEVPAAGLNHWWTVIAGLASFTVGLGAVAQYALGVLVVPILADTGWDPQTLSTGIALFMSLSAISVLLLGVLIDKVGPRWPIVISIVCCVGSLLAASQAQSAFLFAAMIAVAGLCFGAGTGIAYMKVISARFDRKRGLALGIATAGTGLGGVILAPYTAFLLSYLHWRASLIVLALTILVVAGSAAISVLPRHRMAAPQGDGQQVEPLRSILLTRAFIALASTIALAHFALFPMMVLAVRNMTAHGLSLPEAAAAMSGMGLMAILGRVTGGHLMDRFVARFVGSGIFLLGALCAASAAFVPIAPLLVASYIAFGLVSGADGDVISYMTSRYFDNALYGRIIALVFLSGSISGSFGIMAAEKLHSMTGSFGLSLGMSSVAFVSAALTIACIGDYRKARQTTKYRSLATPLPFHE